MSFFMPNIAPRRNIMRQKIDLMTGWQFTDLSGQTVTLNLPHTAAPTR